MAKEKTSLRILAAGDLHGSEKVAKDLAAKAKKLKVAAISSVIPFYYGYSIGEIADYYKKLIQLSERPLIVYYAPDNSGVKISNNEFIDNIVRINDITAGF